MHAMWVSLKENVKCGSKLADVVGVREGFDRSRNSVKARMNGELYGKESPFRELMYRSSYAQQAQLFELHNGDSTRNIIEMIVQRASTNPSKSSSKIKSVLRVKNPIETLERFEIYREKVKKMTKERHLRHPRSTVDGNEVMIFYCTTMTCCNGDSRRVTELCNGSNCRVCRLVQSNFTTECESGNGIQLSTSIGNNIAVTKATKAKSAVIVCRTIAGSIDNVYGQEYLLVQNPSALLPCFVIVFNYAY